MNIRHLVGRSRVVTTQVQFAGSLIDESPDRVARWESTAPAIVDTDSEKTQNIVGSMQVTVEDIRHHIACRVTGVDSF